MDMRLSVDSREDVKYFKFLKDAFPNHSVDRVALKTGDYVSDKVMVERKSLQDLHQSTFNGRLNDQIGRMVLDDRLPVLLVTGNLKEYSKKLENANVEPKVEMLFSVIAENMVRYNIPVFWVENVINGLIVIVKFMEKMDEDKWMVPLKRDSDGLCARLMKIKKWQWIEIKERFGPSMEDMSMCDVDDFKTIDGIGPMKAKFIKRILCEDVV